MFPLEVPMDGVPAGALAARDGLANSPPAKSKEMVEMDPSMRLLNVALSESGNED